VIVADTNLIAYLLIPGEKTAWAERVYARDAHWQLPRLWRSELRSVLMSYVRNRMITLDKATQIMVFAERRFGMGVDIASADVLALAAESGCSAYDCEFLALAKRHQTLLVTSDKKVLRAFPELAVSPEHFISMAE